MEFQHKTCITDQQAQCPDKSNRSVGSKSTLGKFQLSDNIRCKQRSQQSCSKKKRVEEQTTTPYHASLLKRSFLPLNWAIHGERHATRHTDNWQIPVRLHGGSGEIVRMNSSNVLLDPERRDSRTHPDFVMTMMMINPPRNFPPLLRRDWHFSSLVIDC